MFESVQLSDYTQKKLPGYKDKSIFVENFKNNKFLGKLGELNDADSKQLSIDKSGVKYEHSISSYQNSSFES